MGCVVFGCGHRAIQMLRHSDIYKNKTAVGLPNGNISASTRQPTSAAAPLHAAPTRITRIGTAAGDGRRQHLRAQPRKMQHQQHGHVTSRGYINSLALAIHERYRRARAPAFPNAQVHTTLPCRWYSSAASQRRRATAFAASQRRARARMRAQKNCVAPTASCQDVFFGIRPKLHRPKLQPD